MTSDLGICCGWMDGSKSEQRLERGHRCASSVVTKYKLVEVHLQMLGGSTAVGALEPGLEVRDGAVGTQQDHLTVVVAPALIDWAVIEAQRIKPCVSGPAIGVDDCTGLHSVGEPRAKRGLARIGKCGKSKTARSLATDLHGNDDKSFANAVSTRFTRGVAPTNETFINLYLTAQHLALGRDHCSAQLLQDQPRGFIAAKPELTLQLHGGNPRCVGGHKVRRPEPKTKRCAGAVHHRSGRDRSLVVTGGALPEMTALQHPRLPVVAGWAKVAVRPTRLRQVFEAGRVIGEAFLKIHDRVREVWRTHVTTLGPRPDGTGYPLALLCGLPASLPGGACVSPFQAQRFEKAH